MHVYIRSGWLRFLPTNALSVAEVLVDHERLTLGAIHVALTTHKDLEAGLAAPAWEPLRQYTDKELIDLAEDDGKPPESAVEANADEAQHHEARIAEVDAAAESMGVQPVRTLFDALEYMVACNVVTRSIADGETWFALNPGAPLPTEVLPMTADEQAAEDSLRWRHLNEPHVQDIIGLFHPGDADPPTMRRTSLQKLARELRLDVETTRIALACLLQDPDFTASRNPETVLDHEVFEIRVDWETFNRTRFSVRFTMPGEE